MEPKKHILLIEPYYGGSHKAFLDGMTTHLNLDFTLLSLPARKWKMRMQIAAPWMAEQVVLLHQQGMRFDSILCSTFIDVAVFKSLLANYGIFLPIGVYFHENQFSYPGQIRDPTFFQFTNINWTSALVADRVFFNSSFNLESFITGIRTFLKKSCDVSLMHTCSQIQKKSFVLYPGIDFTAIDNSKVRHCLCKEPVIVWNHRWEHDKDPGTFFSSLFCLQDEQVDFKLIVLGQSFQRQPAIFAQARERLNSHILHFGYAESKELYASLLRQGDVVVSTAIHEFFGISVLEAVRAGCRPFIPERLSYPELYPACYLYKQEDFFKDLKAVLKKQSSERRKKNQQLASGFSWTACAQLYEEQLELL